MKWANVISVISNESDLGFVGKKFCSIECLRMNPLPRLAKITSLFVILSLNTATAGVCLGQNGRASGGDTPDETAIAQRVAEEIKEERREFQLQELMLAKAGSWIFKPGETPRVLWRDVETVRRLGGDEPLQVRQGERTKILVFFSIFLAYREAKRWDCAAGSPVWCSS